MGEENMKISNYLQLSLLATGTGFLVLGCGSSSSKEVTGWNGTIESPTQPDQATD